MTLPGSRKNGRSSKWKSMFKLGGKNGASKNTSASYLALFRPLQDIQSRLILFCGVVLAIAAGAPLPIIGVIFARIIDAFPPTEDEIHQRISQLLTVATAYFAITWGWATCWGIVGARISRGLRIQMVDRALGMDQTYYETECPDITSRLTVDAQTVQSGTAEKVGIFIQSVSYFVVAFIVGFILNARLTAILFAAVIPSMALVIFIGTTVLNRYSKESSECTTSATSIAEGAIKAVQVVQAFNAFEYLTNDHRSHLAKAMEIGILKAVAGAVLLGSVFFIAYAANALAFWQGSQIVKSNQSSGGSAGTVYAIVFLILDASFVIGQAGPFIQSFSQAASAGRRILDLIDYPDIPIDVYSNTGHRASAETFREGKEISFAGVRFSYPARPTEKVLDFVSFRIKTGTTVGIVGASGSGKSTIAALLLRLYDSSEGTITVDGHSITEFNLSSLRNAMALVDQDPAVFSGSIYTNIRDGYKGPELIEEEMRGKCVKAAKAADAWSFIELLPNGMETWLGEPAGTKLSGGQKQRLCLARALVGDPSILILDEATSALDTISEQSILESLGTLRSLGHRTTVIIAHRLASVKHANNIIVMGKGKILEQGNHESLMSNIGGAYYQLIDAQKLASDCSTDSFVSKENEAGDERVADEGTKAALSSCSSTETLTEGSKPFGTFTIIKRCLALTRSKLFFTLFALLGSLVTGGLILGESIIFGHLVQLLNSSVPSGQVDFYCLMFFVVSLVALIGYVTSGSCFGLVSEHLIFRTRDLSLQTILRQDMEWFLKPERSSWSLISVVSMDAGHLSGLSGVIIGTVASALVSVLGGAILALIVAWKVAIVLFATSPVVISAGFLRLRVLSNLEEKNQLSYTDAASLATEACSSIRTIAALGTEKATLERFYQAIDKFQKQTFKNMMLGNAILAFALSVTYYVYSLAYWWGSKQVRSGNYTSLQFFTVLPAILFSAQAAGQIFSLAPDIGRAKGAASRVFTLHDQRPKIDTSSGLTATPSPVAAVQRSRDERGGAITFQNVSLAYQSRPNVPVFTNLNFTIRSGETVALVGRSGAGKTSVINLLERFYDPISGAILMNGVDITSVPVTQHRARFGLVAQEPDLFSGTIAFNIGLGARPGHVAIREEVIEACKAVGIHEFIDSLPDGYETQCGNNGSQLSGGQKQRVAIARAYIRDPEVLLLDEATSALDSQSEAQIRDAISKASRKRTTIMIAHRLTSVQKADRILVFDQGRIVEEGRHEELMRGGGLYEQMIKLQNLG